jgi:hypothetical protein
MTGRLLVLTLALVWGAWSKLESPSDPPGPDLTARR